MYHNPEAFEGLRRCEPALPGRMAEAEPEGLPQTHSIVAVANRAHKGGGPINAVIEVRQDGVALRAEVCSHHLNHAVQPVSAKPEAERQGIIGVELALELNSEEVAQGGSDQEVVIGSFEVQLNHEEARTEDGRELGHGLHLEMLGLEIILEV